MQARPSVHSLSWFLAVVVLPSLLKYCDADCLYFLGNSLVILQECLFYLGSNSYLHCVKLLVLHLKYILETYILKYSVCPTCDSKNDPGRIWGLRGNLCAFILMFILKRPLWRHAMNHLDGHLTTEDWYIIPGLFFICTIFKVFIEFVTILLLFWTGGFGHEVCGILVSWPGIEFTPPALEGEVLTTGPPGKALFPGFDSAFDLRSRRF